jgi:SAM-dependent methyltransferase
MHFAAATRAQAPEGDPAQLATDEGRLPQGLRLRCPRCSCELDGGDCRGCGLSIAVRCGIVRALAPDRHARLGGFMDQYERIRRAEGRGSASGQDYLALPYRDPTGKDPRQWQVRRRSHDFVLQRLLPRHGCAVLDLGAGNGWMSYRLALAGHAPCAVDLQTNDTDGLGAARHYRGCLPALFPRFQASFDALPFVDGQFDAAIFNASFHYSEGPEGALREALRCVRPGAPVIISDTPWYRDAQDGQRMLAERRASFRERHGIDGDAIASLGFLTDARLRDLERAVGCRWDVHRPWYGAAWALRPLLARMRGRRRPSRFRLYVARMP